MFGYSTRIPYLILPTLATSAVPQGCFSELLHNLQLYSSHMSVLIIAHITPAA